MNCYQHKNKKADAYISIGKIIYMCCKECAFELQKKIKKELCVNSTQT